MGQTDPMGDSPARFRYRTLGILAGMLVLVIAGGSFLEARSDRVDAGRGLEPGGPSPAAAPLGEEGTCGGKPVSAPRELRAMWLTTVLNIDWPSQKGLPTGTVKQEFLGWLDLAEQQRHNAIYVHVRPSGDAFWPSKYAPWSEWLTGKRDGSDPGWDPMAWMIEQTHARNIEFHAWFNPYRGTQPAPNGPGADLNQLAPDHPLLAHPEWRIAYPVGTANSRLYFDPGIPEARKFVEDSMLESVEKYDVDGVDFDDFFYPYPESGQDFPDQASYATYGGGKSRADWRRDNVNTLIREMNERIKAMKPWVKFGISPFGIWRNSTTDPTGSATRGLQSFDEIYADTRTWVQQKWLDSISPQLYWTIGFGAADYSVLVKWWSAVVEGTGVQLYIAQGDYRVGESGAWSDPGELDRQMDLNGQYHVDGTVHFSAKSVRTDALGAITRYRDHHYAGPALMPVMPQLPAKPPPAPGLTGVTVADGKATIAWQASPGATSYAVYRLDPGAEQARLVGSLRGTSFVDSSTGAAAARYCVSALDRSWNEGRISPVSSV